MICRYVYVKLESFNPSSSVKDSAALNMIEDAEKQGLIKSGASTYIALQIAKSLGKGKKILSIIPNTGERYLNMELVLNNSYIE